MAVDTFGWGLETRKRSGKGNPYALSNRVGGRVPWGPKSNTPTPPATTATAGCSSTTSWTNGAAPLF